MNEWELERQEHKILAALAGRNPDCDAAAQAIDQLLSDPEIQDLVNAGYLLSELSYSYANQERYQEALAAMERAKQAGLRCTPDPRVDIARFLLKLGQEDEAAVLLAQVHAEMPEDVWLYNGAGMNYQDIGQHEEALRWLTLGLELAMRTGDPEDIVAQLSDLRRDSLAKLGRDHDALENEVDAFLRAQQEKDASTAASQQKQRSTSDQQPANTVTGIAWFPEPELAKAIVALPAWLEAPEKATYAGHRLAVENLLRKTKTPSGKVVLTPIAFAEYADWCSKQEQDAAESESVAAYAATLVQQRHYLPWPPGRNEPCWCGSSRKYKKCCGSL